MAEFELNDIKVDPKRSGQSRRAVSGIRYSERVHTAAHYIVLHQFAQLTIHNSFSHSQICVHCMLHINQSKTSIS